MKKLGSTKYNAPIIFMVFILLLWELLSRGLAIPTYILPAPSLIAQSLVSQSSILLVHAKTTFLTAVIGLFGAIILALLIALVMDKVFIIKKAVYPLLIVSQTIPIIALAPLMIIWFGLGLLPKVLIVTLVCFFPIVVSLVHGFENVDSELLDLMKIMNAKLPVVLFHVKLPSALPHFFAGIKISATYSVMAAVIGEWLGASAGLGIYMTRAMHSFSTSNLFAAIVCVVILSLILFKAVELIEKLTMPWNRIQENTSWEE